MRERKEGGEGKEVKEYGRKEYGRKEGGEGKNVGKEGRQVKERKAAKESKESRGREGDGKEGR